MKQFSPATNATACRSCPLYSEVVYAQADFLLISFRHLLVVMVAGVLTPVILAQAGPRTCWRQLP